MKTLKPCSLINKLMAVFVFALVLQLIGSVSKLTNIIDGTGFNIFSAVIIAGIIVILHYMSRMGLFRDPICLGFCLNAVLLNSVYLIWWDMREPFILFFFVELVFVYFCVYSFFGLRNIQKQLRMKGYDGGEK